MRAPGDLCLLAVRAVQNVLADVGLHVDPERLLTDDLLSGEATRMEVLARVVHGRHDLLRQCLGHNDSVDQYLGRAKLLSVEECTLVQAHGIRKAVVSTPRMKLRLLIVLEEREDFPKFRVGSLCCDDHVKLGKWDWLNRGHLLRSRCRRVVDRRSRLQVTVNALVQLREKPNWERASQESLCGVLGHVEQESRAFCVKVVCPSLLL